MAFSTTVLFLGLSFLLAVNSISAAGYIGFDKVTMTVPENIGQIEICATANFSNPRGFGAIRFKTTNPDRNASATSVANLFSQTSAVTHSMNRTCLNATVLDNNIVELAKVYYINLTDKTASLSYKEGRRTLKIIITSDDTATARFQENYNKEIEENCEYTVVELVCVIDKAAAIPLQIGFEIDNFTSTAVMGSDFTIENKTLTFPPGETKVPVKIKIYHDGESESPEILVLRMVSLDDSVVVIGKPNTAKVKITDKLDNDKEAARKQEIEKDEKSKRREVYILLIVAIVLISILFICGIVCCICFFKSRKN